MSRVISFRDLQRVESLAGFTETELLKIENDAKVNAVLAALGFDMNQPILYEPSKHRDMAGSVAVGFRAVGEINGYSEYMDTRMPPLIERLIWASKTDMSLAFELSRMMGHTVNLMDDALEDDVCEIEAEYVEQDYEMVQEQIEALIDLRNHIRGSAYNEYGNLKTPGEYKEGMS